MQELTIVGGGLAGSEAAWQAAQRGIKVRLYEMRPAHSTGAHTTDQLAELVCSNSLGSSRVEKASGLLKEELRCLGSMLLESAQEAAVPAGSALAVDRTIFAQSVTARISSHPNIQVIRSEVKDVPAGPAVIASGPLTSPALSASICSLSGQENLFFFDAISPTVTLESVDLNIAFRDSRYLKGERTEGDYINCPLDEEEYIRFVTALGSAERIPLKEFEQIFNTPLAEGVKAGADKYFEGCLPVEIIAGRGQNSLAFGPMRPVGLRNPHTDRRPFAVVQLRQDNLAASLYNLVGFQTNLTFPEQKRVIRLIPGLQNAEFVRYGQMHRNTFIASPLLLQPSLQMNSFPDLFFAGQITGVEGYMGNIATGLLAGVNAARYLQGQSTLQLPATTMLGALCHYITHADMADFQPMKANFGILQPFEDKIPMKSERQEANIKRALDDVAQWSSRVAWFESMV